MVKTKKDSKNRFRNAIFGCFLVLMGLISGVFSGVLNSTAVYAEPGDNTSVVDDNKDEVNNTNNADNNDNKDNKDDNDGNSSNSDKDNKDENTSDNGEKPISNLINASKSLTDDACQDSLGSIGWMVCPATGKIAEAVDWLYEKIQSILVINPISIEDGSPIYEIWKYCRDITNVVFIIFLLVVIYSQLTGVGIANYGIKKALPKLIIAAVLVNLSFLVCSLAVDLSNIIGEGLRGLFTSIEQSAFGSVAAGVSGTTASGDLTLAEKLGYAETYRSLAGGAVVATAVGAITFESGVIWMLIPVVLGAIVAVATGLITIAMRQALVVLLIMISPLAMVAYILPNTEGLFKKWKQLLTQMLVFYPVFSLLFGASSLAGLAIVSSAKDGFGVLLGIAVQIFPLFFSWQLMKMSGTVLGTINMKIRGLTDKPLAASRVWADSHRMNRKANTLANGVTPSAKLTQFLAKRKALREEDTKNALEIVAGKNNEYVQKKIARSEIGDTTANKRASRYTRNAKVAKNYSLISQNATAHTEHALSNYNDYYVKDIIRDRRDREISEQSQNAWIDAGRAVYQKEFDDESDIKFLTDKYLDANKRDENNRPLDEVAFKRYISSVAGPDGEQRLIGKVLFQASKVESKQRSEYSVLIAKYGHNGYNKGAFRSFTAGYMVNDDGWAVDLNGKRLKDEDGNYIETIQGEAITKAPDKLVLYNKRDEKGLYYDMKDQEGNIVARIHRGTGADGENHDDVAFMKEALSNADVPIGDPINNVYGILSGIKPGSIITPQGQNEIGLSRYSTTIGRAMGDYKGNAAWAGAMFNTGIGNRQITNAAQYAIWVCDSIKKTLKPGAFNTQNPASVEFLTAVLNPDNWEKIFTEQDIINGVNINNEPYGGEDWVLDDDGNIIDHIPVENPTYEQRMNTIKRKFLFPAMKKILPALDRLRTSNTVDNQKPGTADAQYEFLKMVEEKWENNPEINFDPTLVDQDLQSEALAFRQRKRDKNGNYIYARERNSRGGQRADQGGRLENLYVALTHIYDNCMTAEELKREMAAFLASRDEYSRALERFEELCLENPDATMREISEWFEDLDVLVRYDG